MSSHTGPVPPLPALEAPTDLMADARANCAARYRARDQHAEADAFARGERDATGYGIRDDRRHQHRLGKKRGGRFLDGVEHNGFPGDHHR